MNNLKSKTRDIIVMQATEAKILGFNRLGEAVLNSVGAVPREEGNFLYSEAQLQQQTYEKLWKVAMEVIAYHDIDNVDIQQVDDMVVKLTNAVVAKVEASLGVEGKIGPLEPAVPGQSK